MPYLLLGAGLLFLLYASRQQQPAPPVGQQLPVVGPTNVPPGAYAPDSPGSWTNPPLAFGGLQGPNPGLLNPQPGQPPVGGSVPWPVAPAVRRLP